MPAIWRQCCFDSTGYESGSHEYDDRRYYTGSKILRPVRVIEHVFAEITLPAISACLCPLALNVTIPAAGDILGRSGRHRIVGAADRIIVVIADRHRR